VTTVGPLEISPLKSGMRATRVNTATCLVPAVRFRVKNASASDVKVALLLPGLALTDDFGESLIPASMNLIKVSGITGIASEPREGWVNWMGSNSQTLTTLSPNQTVDAQITSTDPNNWRTLLCKADPASELFRTYRPPTFSLTATIGVADLDGNATVRSFSFSDAPLQVQAR
jgi:hypothetical protein